MKTKSRRELSALTNDKQEALNALVFKYGSNFRTWPDYFDRLKEAGLTQNDVSDTMFVKADKHARGIVKEIIQKPIPKPVRDDYLTWLSPVQEEFEKGISTFYIWQTDCGRYRVAKVAGDEPRFMAMAKVGTNGNTSELMINKYDIRTLDEALSVVERYHNAQFLRAWTNSNRQHIVREAEAMGLHDLSGKKLVRAEKVASIPPSLPKKPKDDRPRTAGGKIPKDRFGSKIGTVPYKINAAILEEYRSVEEIIEACGIPRARVRSHLNWLLGEGKVQELNDKWRIKLG